MRWPPVLVIFALALSAASGARAAERAEAVARTSLRVCADPSALPFSNENGAGFENKIAELFATKLGVPLKYVWYPNSMGFLRNTLLARRCDLVMGLAAGTDVAQGTNPYYHSTYVMVSRQADNLAADRLTDPALKSLRIGLVAGTPPTDLLVKAGLIGNVRPYELMVDTRAQSIGEQMTADLINDKIDVAILWGPIGSYFASRYGSRLNVTPLLKEAPDNPMDYEIVMGVRPGENGWKSRVNALIHDNYDAIQAILRAYRVPLVSPAGGDK